MPRDLLGDMLADVSDSEEVASNKKSGRGAGKRPGPTGARVCLSECPKFHARKVSR